jgi:hypothetical protein
MKRQPVDLNAKQNKNLVKDDGLPNIPIHGQHSPRRARPVSNNQGAKSSQNERCTRSVTMEQALLEDSRTSQPPEIPARYKARPFTPMPQVLPSTEVVRTTSDDGKPCLMKIVREYRDNGRMVSKRETIPVPPYAPKLQDRFLKVQYAALSLFGPVKPTKLGENLSDSQSFSTRGSSVDAVNKSRSFTLPEQMEDKESGQSTRNFKYLGGQF